jgi:hypothetical protein
MKKLIAALFLLLAATASAGETHDTGLVARHLAPTGSVPERAQYEHMWYYRTEVFNSTAKPLRIVWFEAYFKRNGQWIAANVLGKTLRGREFTAWFTEGAPVKNGVINPGETAACGVNWSGSADSRFTPTKWAFIAVDDDGNDYYAEAAVDPNVARYVHYGSRGTR